MAWVEIQKRGSKKIHKVTDEAYNIIFKPQGFILVNAQENKVSTASEVADNANTQPKAETPVKRQYRKRADAS